MGVIVRDTGITPCKITIPHLPVKDNDIGNVAILARRSAGTGIIIILR
jgi:hypothetical protein